MMEMFGLVAGTHCTGRDLGIGPKVLEIVGGKLKGQGWENVCFKVRRNKWAICMVGTKVGDRASMAATSKETKLR